MDVQSSSGLPASIEAAWGRKRPRKGPKPGLSLDRIVAAAVTVAESEGLPAVSMNRVAEELGASTMSLYRYVSAKDELLRLMADAAYGAPPAVAPKEGWRAGLSRWAWTYLERLRAHPWVLGIPISGPSIAPNEVAWLEAGLSAMRVTGLAEGEKVSVVLLLGGFVKHRATLAADLSSTFQGAGATPDEAMASYGSLIARLTDSQRFPAVTTALAAGVFDGAEGPDDEFIFGLERVLDGIEVLVRARTRRPSWPMTS